MTEASDRFPSEGHCCCRTLADDIYLDDGLKRMRCYSRGSRQRRGRLSGRVEVEFEVDDLELNREMTRR